MNAPGRALRLCRREGRQAWVAAGAAAASAVVVAASLLAACRPATRTGGGDGDAANATSAQGAGAPGAESAGARGRRASGSSVLLITIDTLRADALGSHGDARGATPQLDRLAAGGVRFAQARAHNVVTLASHATILSGRHPFEHGVRDNSGYRFPAGEATLATVLRARGYRTGAFVSAFPLDSRFGLDAGFDVYEDGFVDAGTRPAFLEQERAATETVALAARWLTEGDGRPAFAWVHLYEPHYPYAPPPPFDRRFAGDPYHGDVAAADAALEPLLGPILAAGGNRDWLVVVTSDHGEALGEHGEATHGIFAYDATLRVPLILHQPRLLAPRVVAEPVGLVDLLPTVLDLLGEEPPAGLAGRSLAPLATGAGAPATPAPATYFEALSGQLNRGWAPLHGLVHEGWKAIRLPMPELYDLGADPGEGRNLAAREPARLRALDALLGEMLAADAGAGAQRRTEDRETRARLERLGYVVAAGALVDAYGEEDDPKRLIGLDAELREIVGLYAAGDLAEARARCQSLLRRRPGMRVALMTLAQIERDLGNLDAAVAAMRQAWELYPADTTALGLLVSYLTQAERAGEAVEVSAAHASEERPDLDVLFVRSLALARSAQHAAATATIEQARRLEPANPMVAVYAGTLALMDGQRQAARAAFEEALALDGATVRAHTALAILHTEEGRLDEAVAHWQEAVALDPREHAKLLAIGARLWSVGQTAQARPLLELFLESAPADAFGAEQERVRRMLTGAEAP